MTAFANDRLAALLSGPATYSTKEVANFFDRTDQWVYWVLRDGVVRADGTPIEPERVGRSRRRRFTTENVEEIAAALHRRGTLSRDRLHEVIFRLHA